MDPWLKVCDTENHTKDVTKYLKNGPAAQQQPAPENLTYLRDMKNMFVDEAFSDVVIKFRDEQILRCHSSILAARSPFLKVGLAFRKLTTYNKISKQKENAF